MAAARDRHPRRRAREVEVGEGDRREAPRRVGLAQHRVRQPTQDRRRRAPPHGGRAHRVARQRGHRGRLGALAADVADDRVPLVLRGGEHVVEVAADLEPFARRPVVGRQLQPRHIRQIRRQE